MAIVPEKLLGHHLVYEIRMLVQAYRRTPTGDEFLNNALIECFCTHARNLIEFFNARKYTKSDYVPFRQFSNKKIESIMWLLNTQVSHLIYDGRTENDLQKIDNRTRREIYDIISLGILEFKRYLLDEYQTIHIPNLPPAMESGNIGPMTTTTTYSTGLLYWSTPPLAPGQK